MSRIYLSADTISGVSIFDLDLLQYENEENLLHEYDFYDCLDTLKGCDFVVGLVSKELYKKIKAEYGVADKH